MLQQNFEEILKNCYFWRESIKILCSRKSTIHVSIDVYFFKFIVIAVIKAFLQRLVQNN